MTTEKPGELRTARLRLRRWVESDREPFAQLNGDPVVMEMFPSTLTREQSDGFADRIDDHVEREGFGLWAVEVADGSDLAGEFIGFTGLWPVGFDAHFTPAIEVGWRLAHRSWGRGYAPEAARAAVSDGFDRLGFAEIVSMTSVINAKSRRVMEKIGMTRDPADDFAHPSIAPGDRLERHVLYRITPDHLPDDR
ncbi:MAG: GNAT family N-acetyltransferase [Actinomycetota bacterium]